jgi:hypothetical protein
VARPSDLFAVSAALLLVFSFLSRLFASQASVSIHLHKVAYAFSPSTLYIVMASFLCFFAAVYSIWPLSMNVKAATWHYWTTVAGIAVFWGCFYLFVVYFSPGSRPSTLLTAVLLAQAGAVTLVLLAQMIFVVNLTVAVIRLRQLP